MASGTLAPLRRCHALRRMVHVSLYPSLSPSSFATASSSPKGAQMHTSRGTERSTADSVHPTGPVGNSPRPRAPEASRTWCFTPAFSMSDLNSLFSSTSSAVEDCGTFASSASSSAPTRWPRAHDTNTVAGATCALPSRCSVSHHDAPSGHAARTAV